MRYAQIRKMDISNGEGVGVSLFVQGCHFHCDECFNQETWDFNGGKPWTRETMLEFLKIIDSPHIQRVSILGGEPLAQENLQDIAELLGNIRLVFGWTKKVWLYTGYRIEDIFNKSNQDYDVLRESIVHFCDVVVDGRYDKRRRDPSLLFRGSSNQRIFKIKNGKYTEYETSI